MGVLSPTTGDFHSAIPSKIQSSFLEVGEFGFLDSSTFIPLLGGPRPQGGDDCIYRTHQESQLKPDLWAIYEDDDVGGGMVAR